MSSPACVLASGLRRWCSSMMSLSCRCGSSGRYSFSTVPGQRSGDRRDRSGNGSLRRSIGGGGWAVQWMGSAVAWASRAVMTWSVCPASRGQGAGVDPVLGGGTAGLVQVPGTGPDLLDSVDEVDDDVGGHLAAGGLGADEVELMLGAVDRPRHLHRHDPLFPGRHRLRREDPHPHHPDRRPPTRRTHGRLRLRRARSPDCHHQGDRRRLLQHRMTRWHGARDDRPVGRRTLLRRVGGCRCLLGLS